MSKEAITKVVQRAISDAAFRRQLSTDPTGALRGFDLSADETAAIRAGDAGRLSALGVDQRMSKAFALGGATVGASRAAGSDLANASSRMASESGAARDGALVSGNLSESDALISDGASARAGIIPTEPHIRTADADGAVTSASRAISDDPDGFLAASDARASGGDDGAKWASNDPDNFLESSGYRAAGETATRASAINDDPDGFLAANAKWASAPIDGSPEATIAARAADQSGATARAAAINDDPDGFLAANAAKADVSGSAGTPVEDSEGYLTSVGYDAGVSSSRAVTDAHERGEGAVSAAVTDAHDRGDRVAASATSGGNAPGGDSAYIDDSESYLSSINTGASDTAVTDAHDRGGDVLVTRIDDGDDAGASAASEDGPNISS